jgi:hypothetical protein
MHMHKHQNFHPAFGAACRRLSFGVALLSTAALSGCLTSEDATELTSQGFASATGSALARLADESGVLWNPLSWTLRLDGPAMAQLGTALESLQLRNFNLLLRNLKTKEIQKIRLSVLKEGGSFGPSRVTLTENQKWVHLGVPYFSKVPEGEWQLEALELTHVDASSGKPSPLNFPLENPFRMPQGKPPLSFQMKKGNISALPRMAVVTTFAARNGGLVSLTELEPWDREAIPVELVKESGRMEASEWTRIVAASPDFPRARVPLVEGRGEASTGEAVARVGLMFDIPCSTQGFLKIVWKKVSDEREYFRTVALPQVSTDCQKTRSVTVSQALPAGEWLLRSTHLVTTPLSQAPSGRLEVLKKPDKTLSDYLQTNKYIENYATISLEKELKRQMTVRLPEPDGARRQASGPQDPLFSPALPLRKEALLFLGRFEMVPVEAQKAEVWDTVFRRTYSLAAVRSQFGVEDVYNAYTLRRLEKGREKGTVQGVLRVSSSPADAKALEGASAEFRKASTEAVAACLTEREEQDPLATVEGTGFFQGLKGGDGMTIKQIKLTQDDNPTSVWIRECYQKKVLAFRFSRKLPASFQAEFKFVSE